MKKVYFIFSLSLTIVFSHQLPAQMTSVVNSLADDEFAHPYDFIVTENIDESIDGICEDSLHRCTLRAALEEASNLGLAAHITFGGLSGNLLIDDEQGILSPPDLSVITGVQQRVILYGSDPGISILMGINNHTTVTGLGFAHGLIGLIVGGDNNLVGANQQLYSNYFHDFSQNGILVAGNNNTIAGNRIGIAFDNTPIGNQFGIFITGADNTIGGVLPLDGNIISGNQKGIGVYTLSGNTYIYGNRIGTDSTGTIAVPNEVGIDNIGPNVFVGNGTPEGANVISGNTQSGILFGVQADGNSILGNRIGTDPSGIIDVPNRDGITLGPGSFNTHVKGNTISHNTNNGILMNGIPDPSLESDFHVVEGNNISSNALAGIAITGASHYNTIGSSLTGILEPNQIKFNGTAGVLVAASLDQPQQNTIRRNSFEDNNLLGILIQAGQGSIQPPSLLNFVDGGGLMTISGTHALAGAVIDIYEAKANQSGSMEGAVWLGEGVVDVNGAFSISLPSCGCNTVVTTATDILGNTSEFSDGIVTSTGDLPKQLTSIKAQPNPFRQQVGIEFNLLENEFVSLRIFDMTGREVDQVVSGYLLQGQHQFQWIPGDIAAGIYYYRIDVGKNGGYNGKLVYQEKG